MKMFLLALFCWCHFTRGRTSSECASDPRTPEETRNEAASALVEDLVRLLGISPLTASCV